MTKKVAKLKLSWVDFLPTKLCAFVYTGPQTILCCDFTSKERTGGMYGKSTNKKWTSLPIWACYWGFPSNLRLLEETAGHLISSHWQAKDFPGTTRVTLIPTFSDPILLKIFISWLWGMILTYYNIILKYIYPDYWVFCHPLVLGPVH